MRHIWTNANGLFIPMKYQIVDIKLFRTVYYGHRNVTVAWHYVYDQPVARKNGYQKVKFRQGIMSMSNNIINVLGSRRIKTRGRRQNLANFIRRRKMRQNIASGFCKWESMKIIGQNSSSPSPFGIKYTRTKHLANCSILTNEWF